MNVELQEEVQKILGEGDAIIAKRNITERAKEYSRENGVAFLGIQQAEQEVSLEDDEKIELGLDQSKALLEIDRLEYQLQDIKDQFKAKISSQRKIISKNSETLRRGKKLILRDLPCFLTENKKSKEYIDLETGEVILTRIATIEDLQTKIFS